jgi:hypothetical protein
MHRAALLAAVLSAAALLPACTIDRAVAAGVSVSPKLAEDCRDHCARLEMRLAAVVVHGNGGACVCEPEPTAATPAAPRASRAGGAGAMVVAIDEAKAAAAQQQSQSHSTSTPAGPIHH